MALSETNSTQWQVVLKHTITGSSNREYSASTSGRLIEGTKVTNWKQAINQMAVAFPDRFEAYL